MLVFEGRFLALSFRLVYLAQHSRLQGPRTEGSSLRARCVALDLWKVWQSLYCFFLAVR